jgi:hypothetical protein
MKQRKWIVKCFKIQLKRTTTKAGDGGTNYWGEEILDVRRKHGEREREREIKCTQRVQE